MHPQRALPAKVPSLAGHAQVHQRHEVGRLLADYNIAVDITGSNKRLAVRYALLML
jgi:hypothetical protein